MFFQIHGGMVSLMQALATPSSTVHNTKYLDTYHESISVLADFRDAFSHPYISFFHLIVNSFSVTCLPPIF